MTEHGFTPIIRGILEKHFDEDAEGIFQRSPLLRYLNIKTVSADRGSKARGSFGNIYAIYVLVEDYVNQGFPAEGNYAEYEGAQFSDLFARQRELPFGSKLQNHALNHRLNQEFRRYNPDLDSPPIIRDSETSRYWINERLLTVEISDSLYNMSEAILDIVHAYIDAKQSSFNEFIDDCETMKSICTEHPGKVVDFIKHLVRPDVDARIFEIVSFAILKTFYENVIIYWGWSSDEINEDTLSLFKTGRTNANDGGIDFVMKPLGRFFQVTETLDVKKYFLDIDKVHRYPITFVVKSNLHIGEIRSSIKEQATQKFPVIKIVDKYMNSVEEIINTEILIDRLNEVIKQGRLQQVISEIVVHSQVEFNMATAEQG